MEIRLLRKDKRESERGSRLAMKMQSEASRVQRELEVLCQEPRASSEGLSKTQVEMERLPSTAKGVCELENYRYGQDSKRPSSPVSQSMFTRLP